MFVALGTFRVSVFLNLLWNSTRLSDSQKINLFNQIEILKNLPEVLYGNKKRHPEECRF